MYLIVFCAAADVGRVTIWANIFCVGSLISFLTSDKVTVETEDGGVEPALVLTLGNLGQLPGPQLVIVHQHSGQGHQQAVSHVQDADDLEWM